jgi:acyl carrier protein
MIVPVLTTVIGILAEQVGIPTARIEPDRPMSAIPDVESIHVLRAITVIEERLGVLIPDDFLFETSTVRELAAMVDRLAAPVGGSGAIS